MPVSGTTAAEIAGSVRDQVASGELAPRAVLPPVRVLAAELGVNRNTVALMYRRLVEAGVAETRGRGGTVIAAVPQLAREGVGGERDSVDRASGNPDPELLPDILAAARGGRYRQPLYGMPATAPGLAEWASNDFAEDIEQPFRTLVTHGAVDTTERLLNAHLARGDLVAIDLFPGEHRHAAAERLPAGPSRPPMRTASTARRAPRSSPASLPPESTPSARSAPPAVTPT